ncbi:hypothetical protein D3C85_1725660 [compost metagenome]
MKGFSVQFRPVMLQGFESIRARIIAQDTPAPEPAQIVFDVPEEDRQIDLLVVDARLAAGRNRV